MKQATLSSLSAMFLVMAIILKLVHFNRKLIGLRNSMWDTKIHIKPIKISEVDCIKNLTITLSFSHGCQNYQHKRKDRKQKGMKIATYVTLT